MTAKSTINGIEIYFGTTTDYFGTTTGDTYECWRYSETGERVSMKVLAQQEDKMNTYKKITKPELIHLFELEKAMHDQTRSHLEQVSKTAQDQRNAILALNVDLRLAQRTITRLSVDETVRQDMDPPVDCEGCDIIGGRTNGQ